jgi:hypothetical protein
VCRKKSECPEYVTHHENVRGRADPRPPVEHVDESAVPAYAMSLSADKTSYIRPTIPRKPKQLRRRDVPERNSEQDLSCAWVTIPLLSAAIAALL